LSKFKYATPALLAPPVNEPTEKLFAASIVPPLIVIALVAPVPPWSKL